MAGLVDAGRCNALPVYPVRKEYKVETGCSTWGYFKNCFLPKFKHQYQATHRYGSFSILRKFGREIYAFEMTGPITFFLIQLFSTQFSQHHWWLIIPINITLSHFYFSMEWLFIFSQHIIIIITCKKRRNLNGNTIFIKTNLLFRIWYLQIVLLLHTKCSRSSVS